ncbi:hypothetical protein K438DRAFT_128454 [Mycena galopus ATCC 62051]|nr:hypothetical protein K438DRAFT_128454 [Mycena galopus ATCC 62051]
MPAGGRNSFTPDEDKLLVKYLAKYNPGVQGRSGNKIYQVLVQNENNKWAWSASHPWAGWQHRYRNNQESFDKRIKAYQQEHGWPTENSRWINGTQKPESDPAESKLKRKRTSDADARKRTKLVKRTIAEDSDSDAEAEARENNEVEPEVQAEPAPGPPSARRRTHVPDIYPDIAVLDVSPEPEPPKRTLVRPPPKPKPTLRNAALHNPDSDFFASVPPTPTTTTDPPSRPPTSASGSRASVTSVISAHDAVPGLKPPSRGLPKLIEGTWRSVFQGVRQWTGGEPKGSDNDSPQKEKEWPPPRVRKDGARNANAPPEKAGDETKIPQRAKKIDTAPPRNGFSEKAADDTQVEQVARMDKEKVPQSVTRRPPPQVNAVASSSRVQLPPASRRASSPAPPRLENNHTQTPHQRPRSLQDSSRRCSPLQPDSVPRRSPSPLDWGSPVGEEMDNMSLPINNAHATRTPVTSASKIPPIPSQRPSPLPSDNSALRNGRRSLSRHDAGSSPHTDPPLPRLSFTNLGINTRRNRDDRSIASGSVDQGSLPRRSRAPSPSHAETHRGRNGTQYQYHLASPNSPRARASHPHSGSGTPFERKTNRRARDALPLPVGFKPTTTTTTTPSNETRRHSFPAAVPRIDFLSMGGEVRPRKSLQVRPRQSLPPRAPSHLQHHKPLPRRRSLFGSSRVPTVRAASTTVSPAQLPASADNSTFLERFGLQALQAMSNNHGFNLEVVRNVGVQAGDLQKTDEVLLHMRRMAEVAGMAVLRGDVGEGEEERPMELVEDHVELRPHRRQHSRVSVDARTATRSPPEPPESPEEPFELRHRRQHSGATATTNASRSAPTSSQRKKHRHRDQDREEEFRPQPLARDVLADTEYSPPSGSRAGAFTRMKRKGRLEEGLQREGQRASGGGTLSAFSRNARMQAEAQDNDMEDDMPPTPQFAEFAVGNVQVLREVEKRDLCLALRRTADVARYMSTGTSPSPYR